MNGYLNFGMFTLCQMGRTMLCPSESSELILEIFLEKMKSFLFVKNN